MNSKMTGGGPIINAQRVNEMIREIQIRYRSESGLEFQKRWLKYREIEINLSSQMKGQYEKGRHNSSWFRFSCYWYYRCGVRKEEMNIIKETAKTLSLAVSPFLVFHILRYMGVSPGKCGLVLTVMMALIGMILCYKAGFNNGELKQLEERIVDFTNMYEDIKKQQIQEQRSEYKEVKKKPTNTLENFYGDSDKQRLIFSKPTEGF